MTPEEFVEDVNSLYEIIARIVDAFLHLELTSVNSTEDVRGMFYSLQHNEDELYHIMSKIEWLQTEWVQKLKKPCACALHDYSL